MYLDITGEPQFIESMILKYDDEAKQTGALIVHSCGFDSIPGVQALFPAGLTLSFAADLGVLFAAQQFPSPGRISAVELRHRACTQRRRR